MDAQQPIKVVLSVDTEEDNWVPTRNRVTVENIRRIPEFQARMQDLGVRPTYFLTYQVTNTRWSADILRDVRSHGDAELAAHLHPWNTPPTEEPLAGRNTMLRNLPPDLQHRKLEHLTALHSEVYGEWPRSFRAGRFGLGHALVPSLIQLGYEVDSSVTPFVDWTAYDEGPDFRGAPTGVYRLGRDCTDPRTPDPSGALTELPITAGFTRRPFEFWSRVHDTLDRGLSGRLRIAGFASRLGLVKKVVLTPENESVDDMLTLSRHAMAEGATFLQMFLHSSSLQAGLSPFTPSQREVDQLLERISDFMEGIQALGPVRFATVEEAAAANQSIPV